jgi:DNA-binding response OmpR family regulator
VARLHAALVEPVVFPASWRLTPLQTVFLQCLVSRRPYATRDALMAALYWSHGKDEPGANILAVMASKMRVKLEPHGIEIQTIRAGGYALSEKSRALIASL